MSIIFSKNGEPVSSYIPEYTGRTIVIGIDSSKSNTALCVGDLSGNILDDYEISGAGNDVDVYDLCKETRKQLKILFQDAKIRCIGIEDIITKKEANYKGVEIHQSRYKITAVYNNLIFMFEDAFNIRPTLVSNWTWKSKILPSEFRTRDHKKGSKDWFKAMGSPYGSRKDDVTDAICIYKYLIKSNDFKEIIRIDEIQPTNAKASYMLLPESTVIPNLKEFEITNDDTVERNATMVASKLSIGECGIFKIPINRLSIEEIYSEKLQQIQGYKFSRLDKNIVVFIKREA